ncbi:hypothetical protein FS837_012735 [Tulasnella sp. UAMH 9824]|nr:hypothetical protein FS837_012735 [Tulasnella sp. UAMH 9824]
MTGNIPFHDVANDIKLATQLATRNFNLPEVVDDRHLSQIRALCGLMNNCWNLNINGRPTAIDCASEIERMGRTIPSSRNGEGDDAERSTELLHALGNLDLQNGRVDEAMKRFYKALGINRLKQETLGVVSDQFTSDSAQPPLRTLPEIKGLDVKSQKSSSYLDTSHAAQGRGGGQPLQSEYERVEAACVEAKKLYDRIGNKITSAKISARLGEFYFFHNNYVKAKEAYREAQTMYRGMGHRLGIAHSAQALGGLRYLHKEYTEAKELYNEAREIYDTTGDQFGMANITLKIGELLRFQGEYAEAEEWTTRARAIYDQIGDQPGVNRASQELRKVEDWRRQSAEAGESYEKAREIHAQILRCVGVADADVELRNDKFAEAEASYVDAQDICHRIGDGRGEARAVQRLGDLQITQKDFGKAIDSYDKAMKIFLNIGDQGGVADANRALRNALRSDKKVATCSRMDKEELSILINQAWNKRGFGGYANVEGTGSPRSDVYEVQDIIASDPHGIRRFDTRWPEY